jgi:hypothetical protein
MQRTVRHLRVQSFSLEGGTAPVPSDVVHSLELVMYTASETCLGAGIVISIDVVPLSLGYRLRLHRARSVELTSDELIEIRAAQRTFEGLLEASFASLRLWLSLSSGAYIRTALGQFSFALVVLKIFTSEFYSIGALFAAYGIGILCSVFLLQTWLRHLY